MLLQRIVLPGKVLKQIMLWLALLERVKDKTYLKTARLTDGAKTNGFNSREKRPFFCSCILVWCPLYKTFTHMVQSFASTYHLDWKQRPTSVPTSQPNSDTLPSIGAVYSRAQRPDSAGELIGSAVGFWPSSSCTTTRKSIYCYCSTRRIDGHHLHIAHVRFLV